jgi:hypothetical protein
MTLADGAIPARPRRKRWYLPRPPLFTFHQYSARPVVVPKRSAPALRAPVPRIGIVTPSRHTCVVGLTDGRALLKSVRYERDGSYDPLSLSSSPDEKT